VRVECEGCQALVVASFAIDADTVRATCPACRHVMHLPATPPAAAAVPPDAAAVPPDAAPACPKCGAPRADRATSCPACGLTVARMAAYVDARDGAVPEPVRAAWTRATAAWSDAARHDELLRLVATHDAYAWAAGRYRTRGGDVIARRQLDRLRRAAEATLLASATARPDAAARPYRATRRVLAVLIVMIAAGAVYATVVRVQASSAGPRSIPGSSPARRPGLERPLPAAPIK
jgi:uncharacterized Zn finger protein (UPF0148 family)